jgi:phospholipid transport system substrate-binding protein
MVRAMLRLPVALAILLVATAAHAGTPTDALREVFTRAEQILTDPATEERPLDRLAAIRALINDALDFREAAALALGRYWAVATPAERHEFTGLLADMIERFYLAKLASQASFDGGPQIRYLGESVDEAGEALVWTTVARRSGGQISLGYRMIYRDPRWKVRDVIVDGVSVAANYRAQIGRVMEGRSVAGLLDHIREKAVRVDTPARATATSESTPSSTTVAEDAAADGPAPTSVVSEPVAREPEPEALAPPPATVAGAAAPSSPPPPAPPRTRAYWLRLGTVEALEAAGRLDGLLDERKLVVTVEPARGEREAVTVYVRLGPFRDATEAVLKLLELQNKGHDPSLVAQPE